VPLFHLFGFYDNELELLHSSSDVIDLESSQCSSCTSEEEWKQRSAQSEQSSGHNDTGTAEG